MAFFFIKIIPSKAWYGIHNQALLAIVKAFKA